MKPLSWAAATAMGLLIAVQVSTASTLIPVVNFSFELAPSPTPPAVTPFTTDVAGDYTINYPIPGWTSTNDANSGEYQPVTGESSSDPFYGTDAGPTVAWVRQDTTLFQVVGTTVEVGATYTLDVDIGWRNDKGTNGYAGLLVNGNFYEATDIGPPLTQGHFSTYSVTYTGTSADAKQPIVIELGANTMAGNTQGDFDNVSLSLDPPDPAVPEPATSTLVGVFLCGFACLLRKKRVF